MDGSADVRRLFAICIAEFPEDTPATRRQAPRTASVIFMIVYALRAHVGTAALGCARRAKLDNVHVARALLPANFVCTNNPAQQKSPAAAELVLISIYSCFVLLTRSCHPE